MKKIGLSLACLAAFVSMQVACTVKSDDGNSPANGGSTTPTGEAPAGMPAPMTPPSADPMAPAPTPAAGKAVVRVVHGSADAPAVDVYVRGITTPVVTGLMYGQTSGWLEVDAGSYEFELRAAGSKASDPIAYKTDSLAIPAGAHITALAAGLLGSQDADSAFRVLPIVETFAAMEKGSARVRVIHAGADAPTVGIDVGNDNPAAPEVNALPRFSDTGGDGVALPADTALWVGVDYAGDRVTSFTTPKLPEGANVLVIATGLLGQAPNAKGGFSLLAVGPNGSIGFIKQDPIMYALHASPDAPRVDAFVGNAEIVDNIGFGELAGPFQVSPGTYNVDFFGHITGNARPATTAAATSSTGALTAGESYLTIATGFLTGSGASAFRLATYREGFAKTSASPELRAIHSSPDAPKVDIGLTNGNAINPVLFGGLSFSEASTEGGLSATAGHLPIGVTPAGQNSVLVKQLTVPAQDQQRAFVIAAGALDPHKGAGFRFLVVNTAQWPWSVGTIMPH